MVTRKSSARPVCPECGRVVDPKRAVPVTLAGSKLPEAKQVRYAVVGIYCCPDCAIVSWLRGFPSHRVFGR